MKIQSYILSILLCCTWGCSSTPEKAHTHAHQDQSPHLTLSPEQMKYSEISLGRVSLRNLQAIVSAQGMLDVPPQNLFTVNVPIGGFVKAINLLPGDRVQQGQLIAILQNPEYLSLQQDYLDHRARLELAQQELNRQQTLAHEEVNARKNLQQAQSQVNSLLALTTAQAERLRLIGINPEKLNPRTLTAQISVYAPSEGYITSIGVNIGKFVQPQDPIAEIANTKHLHAELQVYESDLGKVKVGQTVRMRLASDATQEVQGKVFLIGKQINADRTVNVHVHLEAENPNLVPKTYLQAHIEVGDAQVSVLPESALATTGEQTMVFVLQKRDTKTLTFKPVNIKTGTRQDGMVQVIFPPNLNTEGLEIVVRNANTLLAQMENAAGGNEDAHGH